MSIRLRPIHLFALLLIGLIIFYFSGHAAAAKATLLSAPQVDFAYSNDQQSPTKGWVRHSLPFYDFFEPETKNNRSRKALWSRFTVNRESFAAPRLALFSDYTTERFVVFVNGQEIYRNYGDPAARTFASFEPALIPFSKSQLKPGDNQFLIRLESDVVWCLGIGNIVIGPEKEVRKLYQSTYFWQYLGPQLVNVIIGILTITLFAFWVVRRKEAAFGRLALVGALWFLRNLHYSAIDPWIGAKPMWELAVNSMIGLSVAFFFFSVSVLEMKLRRIWMWAVFGLGVSIIVSRYALLGLGLSDAPSFVPLMLYTLSLPLIFFQALLQRPSINRFIMLVGIAIAVLGSQHDFAYLAGFDSTLGFQIQPYAGLVVFLAFLFVLGRRFVQALDSVEGMNEALELKVAQSTESLLRSEEVRRQLEVTHALDAERERIMYEIHDRIGASLVTALTTAEHRGDPPEAVATLRNSLLDLKIAVDSLENVDGDLTHVLASFRHRIEGDMERLGLRFAWEVMPVPDLPWMDPTDALHVFRIIQEIFSNIMTHADATEIRVSCAAEHRDGKQGVMLLIADDGKGFDQNLPKTGKGLAGIQWRAKAISGQLNWKSAPGKGCATQLWLPLERPASG